MRTGICNLSLFRDGFHPGIQHLASHQPLSISTFSLAIAFMLIGTLLTRRADNDFLLTLLALCCAETMLELFPLSRTNC